MSIKTSDQNKLSTDSSGEGNGTANLEKRLYSSPAIYALIPAPIEGGVEPNPENTFGAVS